MASKKNVPDSPFLIERLMRDTRRGMENSDFSSEDDFRDKMSGMIAAGMYEKRLNALQEEPEELAQELAYEAYESQTGDQALDLSEKALAVDPQCVDALCIKAFLTGEDAGQLIADQEHAISCAEHRLGEEFFAEFMGEFWPMVEARPYMRAIKQLAEVLWRVGRRFDAVEHYINLLDLDPDDHQGNSALLLGCYLTMGEVQRSWDMLEEYDDDSAVFQYSWLLVYLISEDDDAAEDALSTALDANPHAVLHLLGMGEEMDGTAPLVTRGGTEEAYMVGQILGQAFEERPTAQLWLYEKMVDMGLIEEEDEDEDYLAEMPDIFG